MKLKPGDKIGNKYVVLKKIGSAVINNEYSSSKIKEFLKKELIN